MSEEKQVVKSEKQVLTELYNQYLAISQKDEKIKRVRELKRALITQGILMERVERIPISYNSQTATASDCFSTGTEIEESLYARLKEICHFIGCETVNLCITTSPRAKKTFECKVDQGIYEQSAERARELGLSYESYYDKVQHADSFEAVLYLTEDGAITVSFSRLDFRDC
jgi:hypothetical protein